MPKPKKGESKQDFLKRCTGEVIAEGKESDQAYAVCNAFWDDANNQRSVMTLTMPVELTGAKDAGGKAREFLITAYTGQPIQTWWGEFIIDIDGIRTKNKIPVLREHKRDRVVGFGNSFKDESHLFVKGDFSEATGDAREVLDLADEGYPWQASVGIWPKKVTVLESKKEKETVNGKEITGPAEIWQESDVGEVSFVSLGADDDTAAISLTMSEGKVPVNIKRKGNKNHKNREVIMNKEELQKEHPELYNEILEDGKKLGLDDGRQRGFDEGKERGIEAERERVTEILAAEADPIETKKAIDDGTSAADCYKRFFEAEKEKRVKGLKQLEVEATPPVGTEDPEDPDPATNDTPDVTLQKKAQELVREKSMTFEAAQKRVMADDPKLAQAVRSYWDNPTR